jgi:SAM-dependent MidA family methyltransferase
VTLRQKIEEEIRERGPIPFSRYMELCLYDPELGYYSRNAEQFGKAGDFYTSSDVHAVFGRLLARQFEEMWRVLGSPAQIEIRELGPGRGLFAQDVLDWSEKRFPEFFCALHYSLVETSPALGQRLQATLSKHFRSGKASLPQWLKPTSCDGAQGTAEGASFDNGARDSSGESASIGKRENTSPSRTDTSDAGRTPEPEDSGKGMTSVLPNRAPFERASAPEVPVIVFANEFFDALPVEVLSPQGELRISEKDQRLVETWEPASAEALEFLDRYSVHPESGERIEASLIAQRYMLQIAAALKRGFIIAIDYGYTRIEQLAGGHRGTISAYRQHSVSTNPYEAPGEQDITAHVNFSALAAAAEEQGMHVQPLLTQSQFLLGIGEHNQFADAFEECQMPQERAKVALQLKHLVTPAGMGERFHVLVASKGIDAEQVAGLSGLTFGKTKP